MSGEILERDERGRIKKKSLSSEDAREMAAKRHKKAIGEKRSDVLDLIQEAGYSSVEEAPTALRIVCEEIAERGTRSIQGIIQYRQLTSSQEGGSVAKPAPGEACSMCGVVNMRGFTVDQPAMDAMEDWINQYRKRHSINGRHQWEFETGKNLRRE